MANSYVYFPESPMIVEAAGGENIRFKLTPDYIGRYEASSDSTWVVVSDIIQPSDNAMAEFYLNIKPNTKVEERTAIITIVGYNTTTKKSKWYYYQINQKGDAKVIYLSPKSPREISWEGGDYQINMTANFGDENNKFVVDGDESFDIYDGQIIDIKNEYRSGSVIFSLPQNNSENSRTANLSISYDNIIAYYQLIQMKSEESILYFENNLINVGNNSQFVYNELYHQNVTDILITSDSGWAEVIGNNFFVKDNFTIRKRSATIKATGKNIDGNEISTEFYIVQDAFEIYPIYRDTFYLYDNEDLDDYINYDIKENNNIIYSGKAYQMPDDDEIEIKLNENCLNQINSETTNLLIGTGKYLRGMPNYIKKFDLFINNEKKYSINFFNDFSYNFDSIEDRKDSNGLIKLSQPIQNYIDKRQHFLYSVLNPSPNEDIKIIYNKIDNKGEENKTEYTIKALTANTVEDGRFVYPSVIYDAIEINGDKYKVKETCANFCLYYKNNLGGYDSLLINGNTQYSESIERNSYKKSYKNTNLKDFNEKQYMNIFSRYLNCYTDYLSDKQSELFKNFYNSNEIYLHNLVTGEIESVILDEDTFTKLTYQNNGNKMFYFNFRLKYSQQHFIK